MGLMDEMRKISEKINQQRPMMTNEVATELVSIHPFIRALGYDIGNLNEVSPQHTADARTSGSERVDYAIKQSGKPIIFIESKAANKVLSENNWRQLYNYFGAEDVRFGILTNGIEYRFYTDLEKLNVMDKQPFLIIDMLNLDDGLVNELEGFTKASFDVERILSAARKLRVLRLLDKEYAQPSEELVRFFARQLYTGPLSKSVIQAFAPVVRQAWREFVEQKIASRLQTVIQPEARPAEIEAQTTVEESPIQPISEDGEIPVFAEYGGQRFEATLVKFDLKYPKTSRILYSNSVYSISKAAIVAIHSVNPKIRASNGWDFWKLRDPYGNKERPIGDLRKDEGLPPPGAIPKIDWQKSRGYVKLRLMYLILRYRRRRA